MSPAAKYDKLDKIFMRLERVMSTTNFSLLDLHENRELLVPDNRIEHPLSDEQFGELAGLLRPALDIGSSKPADWREGHRAGLLLALTLMLRSCELHPDHNPALNAL